MPREQQGIAAAERPVREHFTLEEARSLQDKRYRATAGYANVQPGAEGRVVGMYYVGGGHYGVDVEWQRPAPATRIVDGFSRTDLLCVFTGGRHKGERAMVPLNGGL